MYFNYCLIVYFLQIANGIAEQDVVFAKFLNDPEILNSHFHELYKSPRYVDKTLIIEEIIKREGKSTILITWPRRFGKSTVLDTLNHFFQIQLNETTLEPLRQESLSSYKMFKNLNIFQNKNVVREYLGKRPVIFMDFSINLSLIISKQQAINLIRDVVSRVYVAHDYLLYSDKLKPYMKSKVDYWLNINGCKDSTESEVTLGIEDILNFLFLHYNVGCIVLIDEFDSPGFDAFLGGNATVFDHVTKLMVEFMNTMFKSNSRYVEKGVIVGISYLFGVGSSRLNNVNIYRFLDNEKYADYFGILENEFLELMNKYNVSEDSTNDAKRFYNGYSCKDRTIYNTFSLMKYITHLPDVPQPYWYRTESLLDFQVLLRNPTIETEMRKLLFTQAGVNVQNFSHLSINHITMLYKMMENILLPITSDNNIVRDLFLSLLLEQGYLKIQKSLDGNVFTGFLPNLEIEFNLREELKMAYKGNNRLHADVCEKTSKILNGLDFTNKTLANEALVELYKTLSFGMEYFYNHSDDKHLNQQVFCFYLQSVFELAGGFKIIIEKERFAILLKREKQNVDNTITTEVIIIVLTYNDYIENGFRQILARQYYKPYVNEKYIIMALNLKMYKNRSVIDMMYQINEASQDNIIKIFMNNKFNLEIQCVHSDPTNGAQKKLMAWLKLNQLKK